MTSIYSFAKGYISHAELTPLSALSDRTVLYYKRNGKPHNNRVKYAITRRLERKSRKPIRTEFPWRGVGFAIDMDNLNDTCNAMTMHIAKLFGVPSEFFDNER